MDLIWPGIAGIIVTIVLVLMIIRCPISFALLIVGTGGLAYFMGLGPAITYIPAQIYMYLAKFTFIAVPLFLLMGYFTFHAGLTADAYSVARDWVGHLPGGLGIATGACQCRLRSCRRLQPGLLCGLLQDCRA